MKWMCNHTHNGKLLMSQQPYDVVGVKHSETPSLATKKQRIAFTL